MTDRDIEMKVKKAVESTAPDGLARLLSDVENRKGDRKMTSLKRKPRWLGVVAACLALVLIAGFGGIYYNANYAVATTVSLDVNPSIELKVNRSEKVLSCTGLNAEGQDILASMNGGADLEGAKLGVAVNAIVGAIVRAGYLDSLSSAILISVEDRDAARGERLQAQLVAEVDGVLQNAANAAGVLSQYMTFDAGLNEQAQQNNISSGKAAYINQVIALNGSLKFDELAQLSVEELRDLIRIGAPAMPIGKGAAVIAASEYAGVLALDSVVPEVDPELDDPVPHYEVELTWGDRHNEYEYTVDAFTGQVLSGLKDAVSASAGEPASGLTAEEAFNSAAEYFHANHPELSGYNIFDIDTEYDRDGFYDVEFWCGGYEFDFQVDARTGQALREITNYRSTFSDSADAGETGTASTGTTTASPGQITLEDAKAAALSHAGLIAGQVTWEKTEKDTENGRAVYEIDFRTADTEYDYEISAADGAVISCEKELICSLPTAPNSPAQTQPETQTPAQTADIGVEAAKSAALKHAGVSAGQVTDWRKMERDTEDGKAVYEIVFRTAEAEYDYEIGAADGAVVSFRRDPVNTIPVQPKPETSVQSVQPSAQTQTADIGPDAAKTAALTHAGVSAGEVTLWEKTEKDMEDGKPVYEIDFSTANAEFDYEIDARTGAVLASEREEIRAAVTSPAGAATDVGEDAAKSAALQRAGVSAADAAWIKCEHDWDDGRHCYELEFECGATVYECQVNAADGAVLSFSSEPCDNLAHNHGDTAHHEEEHHDNSHHASAQTADIGADAAVAAALTHAGLTQNQITGLKCERDYDDGRLEYEIEFKSNGYEYEYKLDAGTGAVLEHERDFDD